MIVHRTDLSVRKAQACRYETDRVRYPVARRYSETRSMRFRFWAHGLWQGRAFHRCRLMHRLNAAPAEAVAYVFGKVGQAGKATSVVRCESGFSPRARNGQYRGLFQMGSSERARFGHSWTALGQSWAALAYYSISGWSPWECA